MINSAKNWRLYLFTITYLEIQLWRRKPQLPSWFFYFFLKEYHINMQSHLKFSYIELPD